MLSLFHHQKKDVLEKRFAAAFDYEYVNQYHVNGFNFKKLPVICSDNSHTIQGVHWGLIPFWVKDSKQAQDLRSKTLNAKSETAFDLPSFRGSISKKRCLVLADGFFEWMDEKKEKIPHFISLKEQRAFVMAGIYDSWLDKEICEIIKSFSILTCDANPLMAKIHNSKKECLSYYL